MHTSYYDVTVAVFTKNLVNLKQILEKGRAHALSNGLTEEALLDARLAPDMFPLLKQVQIVTDNAKGAPARLAGVDPITLPDTETTMDGLLARIDVVIAHLATYTEDQFAGASERHITMPYYPGQYILGRDYVIEFALANFFFHMNMVYGILRNQGVTLGKADYIGGMSLKPIE